MKTAVLTVLMVLSTSLCAVAKDKGGVGPQTDFKNMPPEQVLALLQNAEATKVDDPSYFDKVTLKACNGKKPGWFNSTYEQSCLTVATVVALKVVLNSSSTVLPAMQALIRGCGLYAANSETSIGDERSGATCGMLGTLLFALGNAPAAKVVWEQAPGCHSHDMNGHPTDGCIREIVGISEWTSPWAYGGTATTQRLHTYDSDFSRLLQMARSSCTSTHDPYACRFISSHGEDVDLAAVQQEQAARSQAIERTQAQDHEEREEKARESDARFNAVMGALQSMPGANDPNAVLNAGNQQAAAIRAIGNANAARQQSSYIPQPQTAIAPQTAMTNSSSGTGAQSAQEQSGSGSGVSETSGASEGTGSSSGNGAVYANPLPSSCVSTFWDPKYYNWLSFQNNCGQAIYLSYIFNSGQYGFSAMNLAVGASGNSGQSQDEVKAQGGYKLAVCPAGFAPVDPSTGNALSQPNQNFSCKKQ
jgi:hypothetical protein